MKKEDYELIKKLITDSPHSLTLRNEAVDKLDKYLDENISHETAEDYAEYCFSTCRKGTLPITIGVFLKRPRWKYKPSRRLNE